MANLMCEGLGRVDANAQGIVFRSLTFFAYLVYYRLHRLYLGCSYLVALTLYVNALLRSFFNRLQ